MNNEEYYDQNNGEIISKRQEEYDKSLTTLNPEVCRKILVNLEIYERVFQNNERPNEAIANSNFLNLPGELVLDEFRRRFDMYGMTRDEYYKIMRMMTNQENFPTYSRALAYFNTQRGRQDNTKKEIPEEDMYERLLNAKIYSDLTSKYEKQLIYTYQGLFRMTREEVRATYHSVFENPVTRVVQESAIEIERALYQDERYKNIKERYYPSFDDPKREDTISETATPEDKKMEENRKKLLKDIKSIENKIKQILKTLSVDDYDPANVTEILKNLMEEFNKIESSSQEVKDAINKLKAELGNSSYTKHELTEKYQEIEKEISNLKIKITEIKKLQVEKYNLRVVTLRTEITNVINITVNPEIKIELENLLTKLPQEITINKITFQSSKYLDLLQYNLLVIISKQLNEILIRLGKTDGFNSMQAEISKELEELEQKATKIETELNEFDAITLEDKVEYDADINDLMANLTLLHVKLENNKDKVSASVYEQLNERINNLANKLNELNEKLNNKQIVDKPIQTTDPEQEGTNLYKEFQDKLEKLKLKAEANEMTITAIVGTVTLAPENKEKFINKYNEIIDGYLTTLSEIEESINKAQEEKKINKEQYENLMALVTEIRNNLNNQKAELNQIEEEVAKESFDAYDFLNSGIDNVLESIAKLDADVEKLKKPIKKAQRKAIENRIKNLYARIDNYEKMLEEAIAKENNPEKAKAIKEKIAQARTNLEKVEKKYRSKCPLMVRVAKRAKDFYKKHKKLCLIAAGLATMAIVHALVGPVLIPALMHGNIMLGSALPGLSGITAGINNVLGGVIGAHNVYGAWTLANGVIINPNVASVSLLKSLGIIGLSSAGIVVPHVLAIKGLLKKGEEKESLLQKTKKRIDNGVAKSKEGLQKIKEKLKRQKKQETEEQINIEEEEEEEAVKRGRK